MEVILTKIEKISSIFTKALIILSIAFTLFILKAYLDGRFHSVETLQVYLKSFGILAPLILLFIQALQVVIPILPGFLGCAVGAVLFGCTEGFLINYIGISLGSIIAFLLAKRYGTSLVLSIFPRNQYEKWSNWAGESKSFSFLLLAIMILPLFPDDFFCYFSGLTKMTTKKFVGIIILGKPWCIFAYSLGFSIIG